MTVLATALTFAALSCKPGVAPFFRLPSPAVTNGEIRTSAIPQRSNATNFVGRLDGHVMSALYGTTEALFERRLFPLLMNYGGARFAPAKKLSTVDFGDGIVKNLYSTNWFAKYFIYPGSEDIVPSCFVHGESRDFSNRFTRVAWPIDLLDGFVYGTRGLTADTNNVIGAASVSNVVKVDTAYMPFNYSLDRQKNTKAEFARFAWLVPKAFAPEDSGPLGTWCLNNTTATADWKGGHLLALGELNLRDCCPSEIFGSSRNPWVMKPPTDSLLPDWAWDFMYDLINGPSYGQDIYFAGIRGGRGDASKITGRDLFWNYPTNDPPHIAKANVTSRFYGERFAFANTVLSLCERSVDYPHKVSWVDATNTTVYPNFQAPRFRYRQRRFSGGHGGSLKMTSSDGCKIVPDDSGVWAVWDLSKFAAGETKTTNWVSTTSSIVENVTAGWSEGTPVASAYSPVTLSGHVIQSDWSKTQEANSLADFNNYEWTCLTFYDGKVSDDALSYSVYLHGEQTNGIPVAPFIDLAGDGYTSFLGTLTFERLEDIPAEVYLRYEAGYSGVEPLSVRPLKGPTSLESSDVTNETEWSIAPAPRAQFLWDNGIIESIDVNKFTTVGVSTNELLLTGIVEDGKAFDYSQGDNIWERQKDTWMYFKYDEAFTGVKSHGMLLANYELFNLTFRNDIEDIAGMNPSDNHKLPTLDVAKSIPEGRVKSVLKDLFDSADGVVSNHLDLTIGSGCTYFGTPLVVQDLNNRASWCAMVAADDFKLSLSFGLSTNPPPRKSAVYGYEAKPVIITNWNFPMMKEESESSQIK